MGACPGHYGKFACDLHHNCITCYQGPMGKLKHRVKAAKEYNVPVEPMATHVTPTPTHHFQFYLLLAYRKHPLTCI